MDANRGGPVRVTLQEKHSDTTEKGYERARDILEAARTIFATEGYAGLSMRTLAGRVGINLSTLQHYYRSKEGLLEAMLSYTLTLYQTGVDTRLAALAGRSRLEQFEAVMDYFLEDIRDPVSNGLLFELWALANRDPFASKILENMQLRSRKLVRNLIRGLTPEISAARCELRAALIIAQIQGLTLYLARNRASPKDLAGLASEARRMLIRLAVE